MAGKGNVSHADNFRKYRIKINPHRFIVNLFVNSNSYVPISATPCSGNLLYSLLYDDCFIV